MFTYDPRVPSETSAEAIRKFTLEEWGVPISEGAAKYWAHTFSGDKGYGEDKIDGAGEYLNMVQQNAAAMFPRFAEQINAGVPPSGLLDGYLQIAKDELGRNVNVSDEVLRNAGDALKDGDTFRQYVRSLPEWDQGPKAQQEARSLVDSLGSMSMGDVAPRGE